MQLRSALERMLGAHVLYADQVTRTVIAGQSEQNAAVAASIARNQQELVDAVTALGGAQVGQQFSAAWQNHVDLLGQYATALQTGDSAAQAALREQCAP